MKGTIKSNLFFASIILAISLIAGEASSSMGTPLAETAYGRASAIFGFDPFIANFAGHKLTGEILPLAAELVTMPMLPGYTRNVGEANPVLPDLVPMLSRKPGDPHLVRMDNSALQAAFGALSLNYEPRNYGNHTPFDLRRSLISSLNETLSLLGPITEIGEQELPGEIVQSGFYILVLSSIIKIPLCILEHRSKLGINGPEALEIAFNALKTANDLTNPSRRKLAESDSPIDIEYLLLVIQKAVAAAGNGNPNYKVHSAMVEEMVQDIDALIRQVYGIAIKNGKNVDEMKTLEFALTELVPLAQNLMRRLGHTTNLVFLPREQIADFILRGEPTVFTPADFPDALHEERLW